MSGSIASRLILGFAVLVMLSVGVALFQMANFREAIRILDAITEDDSMVLLTLNGVIRQRSDLRALREAAITEAVLAQDGGPRQQLASIARRYEEGTLELRRLFEELRKETRDLAATGVSADRRRLWTQLGETGESLGVAVEAITNRGGALLERLQAGEMSEALVIRREIEAGQDAVDRDLTRATQLVETLTRSGRQDILRAYQGAIEIAVIVIAVMVLAGAMAAWWIGRSITRPLARFAGYAQAVGQGDLTPRLPEVGAGELGSLSRDLNAMTESLSDLARRTRSAAEEVGGATANIRSSAQQQAAAMAEQLAALEQTTATLTEITQSGAQITGRAQDIERKAQSVAGTSEDGLKAVEATTQAMDAIREQVGTVASTIVSLSERTQAIGDIILTVNAIAERAHLLALNASIEAAAAGEHGRTFSVVAGEIKRLADQSRDATQRVRANLGEIQQGITSTVMLTEEAAKRVETGRRQTASTERTIRDMADNIQESVFAFQQIVAATNQHQIGLEQVMQALQSVRQASSQTAASTRQLEGAAGDLSALSTSLVDTVRNYRL